MRTCIALREDDKEQGNLCEKVNSVLLVGANVFIITVRYQAVN